MEKERAEALLNGHTILTHMHHDHNHRHLIGDRKTLRTAGGWLGRHVTSCSVPAADSWHARHDVIFAVQTDSVAQKNVSRGGSAHRAGTLGDSTRPT